jgi:hypothetical protein
MGLRCGYGRAASSAHGTPYPYMDKAPVSHVEWDPLEKYVGVVFPSLEQRPCAAGGHDFRVIEAKLAAKMVALEVLPQESMPEKGLN